MRLPSIERLNRLDPEAFATAVAAFFERSRSFAGHLAAARPFGSYEDLLARGHAIARAMPEPERIELLNAHPRIGERPAAVSAASYREQGYERERAADPEELERLYHELAALNKAYERRFGFRFVVFVEGRSKAEVRDLLRRRIGRGRAEELVEGLDAVFSIAEDRLRSRP